MKKPNSKDAWKDRCVVVAPRHAFIRPWIRAYFASGNTVPLVIATGPKGDWKKGDMEFCKAAAKFSGGMVLDCSSEWKKSEKLAERAVLKNRVGWYSKKLILHTVAKKLAPKSWAWIDDDAEITGNIDECFDYAERSPGFIAAQFYFPGEIDNRHPLNFYRSNIDLADKLCWNSFVFFHRDANERLAESLDQDFPVEDDECIFCLLYNADLRWHEGFCDFSARMWQINCKIPEQLPISWRGKIIHYTSSACKGALKKMWAAKASTLPKAPFETTPEEKGAKIVVEDQTGPVDAVFVIGTGSRNANEELRYALRNMERNCPFVRDVYICGECPAWIDRTKVKHLQWPDRFSHAKDANIIDKLRHACEHPGIAKNILFCSDDQFQTRVCSWGDFSPRHLRRYSPDDRWYEQMQRVWHSRLRKTLERERQRRIDAGMDPKEVYYYQPHIWMPMDRDLFISYAKWCGYESRSDTIIASGYFNFANVKGQPNFDHEFLSPNATGVKSTHVAYHDGSYAAAIKMLRAMFPEKSRFELYAPNSTASAPRSSLSDTRKAQRDWENRQRNGASSANAKAVNGPSGDDPSPATGDEMSNILRVSDSVRRSYRQDLLGEISRAEEMRLFGARGWRTVWRDIIARWDSGDAGHTTPPGEEAQKVVKAYMADPGSLRTVRIGMMFNHILPPKAAQKPAQAPITAPITAPVPAPRSYLPKPPRPNALRLPPRLRQEPAPMSPQDREAFRWKVCESLRRRP